MSNLSRSYRPQTFADITAQEAVKETLRLEVESGKIGHAYLFGGPRGVGKTTAARIFAKALNCLQPKKGEPCNTCEACQEFDQHHSLDIIEMDAASNTGVDHVREAIVEHVRFAPSTRKYKVYILDEAHMLSVNAWNALLKTIEEPPSYAIFILITTEVHKVPATILSRCQRFDFKRISDTAMAERLSKLTKKEKISIDPAVQSAIIRKSDGCLRDAESLLTQLMAFGEQKITMEIAELILPVSRLPIAADLLELWSKHELGPALQKIQDLEDQGIPLLPLFDDLIQAIRELLLAADLDERRQKLANGDDVQRKLAALSAAFPSSELHDIAMVLLERRRDAKQGIEARFALELATAAITLGILPSSSTKTISNPIKTQPNPTGVNPNPNPNPNSNLNPNPNPNPTGANLTLPSPSLGEGSAGSEAPSPSEGEGVGDEVRSSLVGDGVRSSLVGDEVPLITLQKKWSVFLKAIEEKSPSLIFILRLCRPAAIQGKIVTVVFQYPYHRDKVLNDMKTRKLVEDTAAEVFEFPALRFEGVIGEEEPALKETRKNDMVSTILKAFGGQVVEGESH